MYISITLKNHVQNKKLSPEKQILTSFPYLKNIKVKQRTNYNK